MFFKENDRIQKVLSSTFLSLRVDSDTKTMHMGPCIENALKDISLSVALNLNECSECFKASDRTVLGLQLIKLYQDAADSLTRLKRGEALSYAAHTAILPSFLHVETYGARLTKGLPSPLPQQLATVASAGITQAKKLIVTKPGLTDQYWALLATSSILNARISKKDDPLREGQYSNFVRAFGDEYTLISTNYENLRALGLLPSQIVHCPLVVNLDVAQAALAFIEDGIPLEEALETAHALS